MATATLPVTTIAAVTSGVVAAGIACFAALCYCSHRRRRIRKTSSPCKGVVVTPAFGAGLTEASSNSDVNGERYAAFLTHDWGTDELGRDNHSRVAKINRALQAKGLNTWFDEDRMHGNIEDAMTRGIDKSACVIVFITSRYIHKVGGKGERGEDDNCRFEFGYAARRKGVGRMVPVVMEQRCLDSTTWTGNVGGRLGGLLYIDCTDDNKLDQSVSRLISEISRIQQAAPPAYANAVPVDAVSAVQHGTPEMLGMDMESLDGGEESKGAGHCARV